MKHLKKIMIHLGAIFGAATLITVPIVACSKSAFNKFVNELRKHPEYQGVELNFASINNVPEYTIHNHVKEIGDQLKSVYSTSNQIRQISQYANTNIKIEEKNGHTFIPAADVDSSQGTNYDAI
jgi:hypothetical protein